MKRAACVKGLSVKQRFLVRDFCGLNEKDLKFSVIDRSKWPSFRGRRMRNSIFILDNPKIDVVVNLLPCSWCNDKNEGGLSSHRKYDGPRWAARQKKIMVRKGESYVIREKGVPKPPVNMIGANVLSIGILVIIMVSR